MDCERREYEYVRKIAETGSFLAAADKLYITQPSLSQFIRRIERHIGAELFDRSHQPVTLTEAGRIYLDIEGQIQELCKVREQRIQDLGQTIGGTVRIGSSNYRSSTILAKAIPVINERYPHIDICLEEGTTRELEDFALQGKTDFSIVVRTAGHSDLEYVELFQEELLLAISPAWDLEREPLYDKKRHSRYPVFDYHSLDGHPFLVMKEGQELRHSFFFPCRSPGYIADRGSGNDGHGHGADPGRHRRRRGYRTGRPGCSQYAGRGTEVFFPAGLSGRLGRRPGL